MNYQSRICLYYTPVSRIYCHTQASAATYQSHCQSIDNPTQLIYRQIFSMLHSHSWCTISTHILTQNPLWNALFLKQQDLFPLNVQPKTIIIHRSDETECFFISITFSALRRAFSRHETTWEETHVTNLSRQELRHSFAKRNAGFLAKNMKTNYQTVIQTQQKPR